ncbi:MAG TPA: glycosyltransferase family 87 protein [Thermosynechococcaceae cyanobacterium]
MCESTFEVRSDLELYYTYSSQVVQGKLPYRDFPVEYPPLALLPMLVPQWLNFVTFHNHLGYGFFFSVQNILIVCAIGLLVLKVAAIQQLPRKPIQILMVYTFLVVISAPLILWRYDVFCALLTIWAVWLALIDRPLFAGIALGFGIAAKLYPLLLIPVFIIHCLARKQYAAAIRLLLGSAIVLLLLLLLLSPLGLDNLLSFLTYHKLRGLQLETLPSGLLLLTHKLGWIPVDIVTNYGAFHLESPPVQLILQGLPILVIIGLIGALASYLSRLKNRLNGNRSLSSRHLTLYILATLLVLLLTNKVFSPQYLIWLLPFIPLRPVKQIALFSLVSVLSLIVYPVLYDSLLDKSLVPILLLNLRNSLVVVLALWMFNRPIYPSGKVLSMRADRYK